MMGKSNFLHEALNATHTYGESEILLSYRDLEGSEWFFTPSARTVEVRTRLRRRVTTTYPDSAVGEGWETLSETTEPYSRK